MQWKVTVQYINVTMEYFTVTALPSFVGTQENVILLLLANGNRIYVTVQNMLDMTVVPIPQ